MFLEKGFLGQDEPGKLAEEGVGQGSVSWVGGHCCRACWNEGSLGEVHLDRCVLHHISYMGQSPQRGGGALPYGSN